jgi:hypothetical protein
MALRGALVRSEHLGKMAPGRDGQMNSPLHDRGKGKTGRRSEDHRCVSRAVPLRSNSGAQSHRDKLRSLFNNAMKRRRSPSLTAVNFRPSPRPGFTWRTTASALICPSGTRKSTWAGKPTGLGLAVSTNKPPRLTSRTRAVSSRSLHRQKTQTGSGVSIRELTRLEGVAVCCNTGAPPFCEVSGDLRTFLCSFFWASPTRNLTAPRRKMRIVKLQESTRVLSKVTVDALYHVAPDRAHNEPSVKRSRIALTVWTKVLALTIPNRC